MENNSALFLVQTPLHVHNAHEAIVKFGITHSTFLVVHSKSNNKWVDMMMATIPANTNCLFSERNDHDIDVSTGCYMRHIPWLQKQKFEFVFFPDTKLYIFVDIVNLLQNENTYLMDDGSSTIQSIHLLRAFKLYFEKIESSSIARRKQIEGVKKKYGIWALEPVKYNIFTAFDFETCGEFEVIKNPMFRLSREHGQTNHSEVLILGQPFIEAGFLTEPNYLSYLRYLREFYHDKRIYYLPHPRESEKNAQTLCSLANIMLKQISVSVEKFVMQTPIASGEICGFYSTALWNIAKFQPGIKVKAIKLLNTDFTDSIQKKMARSNYLSEIDNIELIYDYFRKRMSVQVPFVD